VRSAASQIGVSSLTTDMRRSARASNPTVDGARRVGFTSPAPHGHRLRSDLTASTDGEILQHRELPQQLTFSRRIDLISRGSPTHLKSAALANWPVSPNDLGFRSGHSTGSESELASAMRGSRCAMPNCMSWVSESERPVERSSRCEAAAKDSSFRRVIQMTSATSRC
jgi:hypothetical protein